MFFQVEYPRSRPLPWQRYCDCLVIGLVYSMKKIRSPSDLAINGAPPAFLEPIHVGCPNLGNRDSPLRYARVIAHQCNARAVATRGSTTIIIATSSGALISCDVLQRLGLMRESSFVDYVDTEWCH